MKKTLNLFLTHYWFDKIASGEKKAEYRRCCKHWDSILSKEWEEVCFHKGYTKTTLTFKIKNIGITTDENDLSLEKCWKIIF